MSSCPLSGPVPARRCRGHVANTLSHAIILAALLLSGAHALGADDGAGAPSPTQIVRALHAAGYVLVMRHAQAPMTAPDARNAEPDNYHLERQLDATGKADARALGAALHALSIPIGPIYSSPTYRALETIRLAGLLGPQTVLQLAEDSHGMTAAAADAQNRWLRQAVQRAPPAGSNTLIVTHTPNIVGAFGPRVADIEAGEMLIFQPHGAHLVGRMRISEWRQLSGSAEPARDANSR